MDSRLYPWPKIVDRVAEVIGELDAQPVAGSQAKIGAKMKVSLGGDAALLVHDFIDPLVRQLRVFGQSVGRDTHWNEEILTKQFSGVDIEVCFHSASDNP